ncbi:unnamed protein product, partial [Choristocarpus tenellus]
MPPLDIDPDTMYLPLLQPIYHRYVDSLQHSSENDPQRKSMGSSQLTPPSMPTTSQAIPTILKEKRVDIEEEGTGSIVVPWVASSAEKGTGTSRQERWRQDHLESVRSGEADEPVRRDSSEVIQAKELTTHQERSPDNVVSKDPRDGPALEGANTNGSAIKSKPETGGHLCALEESMGRNADVPKSQGRIVGNQLEPRSPSIDLPSFAGVATPKISGSQDIPAMMWSAGGTFNGSPGQDRVSPGHREQALPQTLFPSVPQSQTNSDPTPTGLAVLSASASGMPVIASTEGMPVAPASAATDIVVAGTAMIRAKSCRCEHVNCGKWAVFGLKGEKQARRCARHRLLGMVDVKNTRCEYPDCATGPTFGFESENRRRCCSMHKLPGMVDVKNSRCTYQGCMTQPAYANEGEKKGRRCARHKLPGMVDVKHSRYCNSEGFRRNAREEVDGSRGGNGKRRRTGGMVPLHPSTLIGTAMMPTTAAAAKAPAVRDVMGRGGSERLGGLNKPPLPQMKGEVREEQGKGRSESGITNTFEGSRCLVPGRNGTVSSAVMDMTGVMVPESMGETSILSPSKASNTQDSTVCVVSDGSTPSIGSVEVESFRLSGQKQLQQHQNHQQMQQQYLQQQFQLQQHQASQGQQVLQGLGVGGMVTGFPQPPTLPSTLPTMAMLHSHNHAHLMDMHCHVHPHLSISALSAATAAATIAAVQPTAGHHHPGHFFPPQGRPDPFLGGYSQWAGGATPGMTLPPWLLPTPAPTPMGQGGALNQNSGILHLRGTAATAQSAQQPNVPTSLAQQATCTSLPPHPFGEQHAAAAASLGLLSANGVGSGVIGGVGGRLEPSNPAAMLLHHAAVAAAAAASVG